MTRYIWLIPCPGGRRGWELWLGPVGLALTWPLMAPLAWNWGWWRLAMKPCECIRENDPQVVRVAETDCPKHGERKVAA